MNAGNFVKYRVLCTLLFFLNVVNGETLTLSKNGQVVKIISLNGLKQLQPGFVTIPVDNQTDSKIHTYEGISLTVLFDQVFGIGWKSFNAVKFVTSDGYQPIIPTSSILANVGILATSEKVGRDLIRCHAKMEKLSIRGHFPWFGKTLKIKVPDKIRG